MPTGTGAIQGKGTYVLFLEVISLTRIAVGKLGIHEFNAGRYAYVGSAFGPGGLAARLAHHCRRNGSPHWHIDYLRPHARIQIIWHARTERACEHLWARALLRLQGASLPIPGFGSTDCRCRAHLIRFSRRPRRRSLRRQWRRLADAPRPPIRQVRTDSSIRLSVPSS